jgi:2-polyprenyl-6-methoxyphenol hydroxylase-like FAD-dependent oxidoreductase
MQPARNGERKGSRVGIHAGRNALRAIVIGAGPAGLATAILLRRLGMEPIVFERQTDLSPGSGLTLWPNAFEALETLGAVEAVRAHCAPAEGLSIRTSAGETLQFISRSTMESRCGGSGWALHRSNLIRSLSELLPTDTIRFGARCVAVRTGADSVTARFADGSEAEGDLLIGADGHRSVVRNSLFGGGDLRYLGYTVVRGVATYPTPPLPGQLSMGRGQQFGLFPLRDDGLYWFAAFNAPEGDARQDRDYLPFLKERFRHWHEPIPAVIDATKPEDLVVTGIYDRPPLRRWGRGSITLIGDAAHPSAPALGQGTCQAFEDAVVLAECLSVETEVPVALGRYEDRRRGRANALTMQARWMGAIGQWSNPLLVALRNRMFKAMSEQSQVRGLNRMFAFESTPGTVSHAN